MTEADKKIKLDEQWTKGYDRLMDKVEIAAKKSQNDANAIEKYIKGTAVYKNATDVQREQLVRDARAKANLKEKPSLSVKINNIFFGIGRILASKEKGSKKKIFTEKQAYAKRLKDIEEGAKNAVDAIEKAREALTNELKELVVEQSISVSQMMDIIKRLNRLDMLKETSIDSFVDYMVNVMLDADYASKISRSNKARKSAKVNALKKLGISESLVPSLMQMLSINPTLIPLNQLDNYLAVTEMIGKREAVLSLDELGDVINTVKEVLNSVQEEQSTVIVLTDMYNNYADKVVKKKDGSIDYAATVSNMVKDGAITEEDAALMKKYKSVISPREKSEPKTKDEIAEERDVLMKELKAEEEIGYTGLPSRDERKLARRLNTLIRSKGVDGLSNNEIKNLLKVIQNIRNGYLPSMASILVSKMQGEINSRILKAVLDSAKLPPITKAIAKTKEFMTTMGVSDMRTALIAIEREPLYYMDQVLGNFMTKGTFDSVLKAVAQDEASFSSAMKVIDQKLKDAERMVLKSFGMDENQTIISKYKQSIYMLQLEYESNKGSDQVNPASAFIKATIDDVNNKETHYSKKDAKVMQEILVDYSDGNGGIDINKLYESFNAAERASIETVKEVNRGLEPMAVFTAAVIRGNRIDPLSNYTHLNVINSDNGTNPLHDQNFINGLNLNTKPSTRAKTLVKRDGKPHAINMDIWASTHRGAKQTLMDYMFTESIRTARITLESTRAKMKADGSFAEKGYFLNAVEDAFNKAIENILDNSFVNMDGWLEVSRFVVKKAYQAVLAGTGRFISELLSNEGYALIEAPLEMAKGISMFDFITSEGASKFMDNVRSLQTQRIFPSGVSGRFMDADILSNNKIGESSKISSGLWNAIKKGNNKSAKKYFKGVDLIADKLISTPDKAIIQTIWFGTFAMQFEAITGSSPDLQEIANNNEEYMNKHEKAIASARDKADEKSVFAGATSNPMMGILKSTSNSKTSIPRRVYNLFNDYMTRFMIFDYSAARTGIMAAIGDGSMSKKDGMALSSAVFTRNALYIYLGTMLGAGVFEKLVDDDDDDDEQAGSEIWYRSIVSAAINLSIGRNFGNFSKMFIAFGVERLNKEYTESINNVEYDGYDHQLMYTPIKKDMYTGGYIPTDIMVNMLGPLSPPLKTLSKSISVMSEDDKKKDYSILRQERTRYQMVPLEVLGLLGGVPAYKDVKKLLQRDINNEVNKLKKAKIEQ